MTRLDSSTPAARALACFMLLLLCLAVCGPARGASSSPADRMAIQSYLTDDTGTPVGNASAENRQMTFTIYNADTGGSAKWAETQIVTINKGHFSAILGEGSEVTGINHVLSTVFDSTSSSDVSDRYIEIKVANTDGSNEQTLSPRLRLLPSAYAFLASIAKTAETVVNSSINTSALADNSVTSAKIVDGTITASDIATDAVDAAEIKASAVGTSELASDAVTAAKIATDAVGSAEIADNAVGSAELANNAVDTAAIQASAVTTTKISDNAVDANKLAQNMFIAERVGLDDDESWSHVFTNRSTSDWFPVISGFDFGTGDLDESDTQNLWQVSWSAVNGFWTLTFQAPTHSGNYPDTNIEILWIPKRLVNDQTGTRISPNSP